MLDFNIHSSVSQTHANWESFCADTIFLRKDFLKGLEQSMPANMKNFYVEYFSDSNLVGIALLQLIDLKNIQPFQEVDISLKSKLSSWALNKFASSVLFIGNNMMSGQNAFRFSSKITEQEKIKLLSDSANSLRSKLKAKGQRIHITVWKDFSKMEGTQIEKSISTEYYKFAIQPSMVFNLPDTIQCELDYVNLLSKKYRDQYKRARKKAIEIEKRQLSISEIETYQERLFELYSTTVANAAFNTFYLPKDHFTVLKKNLGADFQLYAYFLDKELIGFNTIVKNGETLEPYFLGYDAEKQKSSLLYLNMLYDIVGYASAKKFKTISFGRTALEIKSSVGAKPLELFGFIKHSNPLVNFFIARIFRSVEPKADWKNRNPFKAEYAGPRV